jgi:hypothetical protein
MKNKNNINSSINIDGNGFIDENQYIFALGHDDTAKFQNGYGYGSTDGNGYGSGYPLASGYGDGYGDGDGWGYGYVNISEM